MEIATAEGSAPAAPAAAPAAPAAPAEKGYFDDIAVEDAPVEITPEPEVDAPLTEAAEPEKEKEKSAEKKDGEKEPKGKGKDEEKSEPKPKEEPSDRLWADKFSKPEDLEAAYVQSSREGRRLRKELDEVDAKFETELQRRDGEIALLKAQLEAGPEPPQLSEKELDELTPSQLIRYNQRQQEWKDRRRDLDAKARTAKDERERNAKSLVSKIEARIEAIQKDEKNYPDFGKLRPMMDELMDWAPETLGHEKSPDVLYFAAYGYRQLQKDRVARVKAKESEETAKGKASADMSRGGKPAPASSKNEPAGGTPKSAPGSREETDAEYNARVIKKHQGGKSKFF